MVSALILEILNLVDGWVECTWASSSKIFGGNNDGQEVRQEDGQQKSTVKKVFSVICKAFPLSFLLTFYISEVCKLVKDFHMIGSGECRFLFFCFYRSLDLLQFCFSAKESPESVEEIFQSAVQLVLNPRSPDVTCNPFTFCPVKLNISK